MKISDKLKAVALGACGGVFLGFLIETLGLPAATVCLFGFSAVYAWRKTAGASLGYSAKWGSHRPNQRVNPDTLQPPSSPSSVTVVGGPAVGLLGFVHEDTESCTTVTCTHGVTFDSAAADGLCVADVRRRWPRHFGPCPLGCGYSGIAYASTEHYVMGDW